MDDAAACQQQQRKSRCLARRGAGAIDGATSGAGHAAPRERRGRSLQKMMRGASRPSDDYRSAAIKIIGTARFIYFSRQPRLHLRRISVSMAH